MNDWWDRFELGFWHPFGPYTGLSESEVLSWKDEECQRYGWTFWSFAYVQSNAWVKYLAETRDSVYALCSHSPKSLDPDAHQGRLLASEYRLLGDKEWQPMPHPDEMKVTNPFKRRGLALAFRVRRIIQFEPITPPFGIEWYSKQEQRWRSDRLPTRGEYLIRKGGDASLRKVCAALELYAPYLAELRCSQESAV